MRYSFSYSYLYMSADFKNFRILRTYLDSIGMYYVLYDRKMYTIDKYDRNCHIKKIRSKNIQSERFYDDRKSLDS